MKFWTGKKIAALAIAATALSAAAGSANADAILTWGSTAGFAGTEGAIPVATFGTGVVASTDSNISRSGLGGSGGVGSLNSSGFTTGFLIFSLTTTSTGSYDLTGFQIQDRASGTGPLDLGLFYSGNNFASPIASWSDAASTGTQQETAPISGITLQPGTTYNFEIKPRDLTSNNGGSIAGAGTYRVLSPSLELDGNPHVVTAAPEPASLGLLGAGVVTLISRRSRKSQNASK